MRRSTLQLVASFITRSSPTSQTATSSLCSRPPSTPTPLLSLLLSHPTRSSPFTHQTTRSMVRSAMQFPSRSGGPPSPNRFTNWQARYNPSGAAVIWSLIAANGAVHLLWRSNPRLASEHFVVSLDSLRQGRYWTAVTAAFSQADIYHLASNLITLYFFGSDIGRIFGGRRLLLLYLAGGVAGSIAHVAHSYYQERHRQSWRVGPSRVGAMGASAAVNAIMVVDILLFPSRTILLYGFIPLPAALLGLLWLWNDVGGVMTPGSGSNVAYAGHLGGAAVGLAYYIAFRRGRIRPVGWW